jgi:hypothetical protein
MIIEIDDGNGRELLSQLHEQGVDARIIKQEQCERCESVSLANIECVAVYAQIAGENTNLRERLKNSVAASTTAWRFRAANGEHWYTTSRDHMQSDWIGRMGLSPDQIEEMK